jgi:hypothetical protein
LVTAAINLVRRNEMRLEKLAFTRVEDDIVVDSQYEGSVLSFRNHGLITKITGQPLFVSTTAKMGGNVFGISELEQILAKMKELS